MQNPGMATETRYVNNTVRTQNRDVLEAQIQAVFAQLNYTQAVERLEASETAYGAINSVDDLIRHPQLRTRTMQVNGHTVLVPASPFITEWEDAEFASVPKVGEHQAF